MPIPFPYTPILDPCNRVENPLSNGGQWGSPLDGNAVLPFQCDGATAFSSSGTSFASGYWKPLLVTDGEVYLNSPSDPGNADNYMYFRFNPASVGSTVYSSYVAHWHTLGVGTIDITAYVAGVGTGLGTFDVSSLVTGSAIDNSHRVGLRMIGTNLSLYLDNTLVTTVSDGSIVDPGYFGFTSNATSGGGFTLFGGGSMGTPIAWIGAAG